MLGIDFSTVYIPSVDPAAVAQLAPQGFDHLLLGYDTSPASSAVRQVFVDAGWLWSPYRFLYPDRSITAQCADVIAAIHAAPEPLPVWLVLDVEESGNPPQAPSIAQLREAMDYVEAADVTPTSRVKPAIYSAPWVWQKYYGAWDEPARRGWGLISAEWNGVADLNVTLYGGWTRDLVIGHQYKGDTPTAIGSVDLDVFRAVVVPVPTPPVPTPPAPQPPAPDDPLAQILQDELSARNRLDEIVVSLAEVRADITHGGTP